VRQQISVQYLQRSLNWKANELGGWRSDLDLVTESALRVGAGGGYFNPAEVVIGECPKIDLPVELLAASAQMNLGQISEPTFYVAELYAALTAKLTSGELLFAVYERNSYFLAPYLFDEERCSDFEVQVHDGLLTVVGYYAVPYDLAKEGLLREFTGED
jgi:hypothetical protein